VKETGHLLGLGQYQNRPYQAVVIYMHLVCFAYAVLPQPCMGCRGATRIQEKVADGSTTAAQDQRRGLSWDDLIASLREKSHSESLIEDLQSLGVARTEPT
jgi:hypothetical protein